MRVGAVNAVIKSETFYCHAYNPENNQIYVSLPARQLSPTHTHVNEHTRFRAEYTGPDMKTAWTKVDSYNNIPFSCLYVSVT